MRSAMHANHRALGACHVFANLDHDLVASLALTSVRSRHERGGYVWRAKSAATHFTVITSGLVKITRMSADGNETIVALFGPRESIGDMAVLASKPYPADAIAVSDSVELLRIDAPVVRAAMARHPSLMAAMNASLIEHSHALQEKIRIMSAGTVPKRLATLLLHLAARFGDERDDGSTFIPLLLSRTECARLVGATVETTIRTFSRWQKDGLVETTAEGFVMGDVGKLEHLTTG